MHGQQNVKKWPNQFNICFLINPELPLLLSFMNLWSYLKL